VCPRGELDLATAGRVRERIEELAAVGFARLLLDLSRLTFLDSTGLRARLPFADGRARWSRAAYPPSGSK
jgi:anti-anti-sigma factor